MITRSSRNVVELNYRSKLHNIQKSEDVTLRSTLTNVHFPLSWEYSHQWKVRTLCSTVCNRSKWLVYWSDTHDNKEKSFTVFFYQSLKLFSWFPSFSFKNKLYCSKTFSKDQLQLKRNAYFPASCNCYQLTDNLRRNSILISTKGRLTFQRRNVICFI